MLRPAFSVSKHARLPPTGYWAHLTFYNDVFMDRGREMQVCVVDRRLMILWVVRCYLMSGERVTVCLVQRHLGALSSRRRVLSSNMHHANVLSLRYVFLISFPWRPEMVSSIAHVRIPHARSLDGMIHTCEHQTKAWAQVMRPLILPPSRAISQKSVILT